MSAINTIINRFASVVSQDSYLSTGLTRLPSLKHSSCVHCSAVQKTGDGLLEAELNQLTVNSVVTIQQRSFGHNKYEATTLWVLLFQNKQSKLVSATPTRVLMPLVQTVVTSNSGGSCTNCPAVVTAYWFTHIQKTLFTA